MSEFEAARDAMVDGQVRVNGVTDQRLIEAMREAPRELFAPKSERSLAYSDANVSVGEGRWLLRPRDFAKLVQALDIRPNEAVLDIASGRGYSAAILARLAEAVVALDSDADLVERAERTLREIGVDNVAVVRGDLKVGVPEQGPFDVIMVNGAVDDAPRSWMDQLTEGGRLGVFMREGPISRAKVLTRSGGVMGERTVFDSGAPLLPGFERPAAFTFE